MSAFCRAAVLIAIVGLSTAGLLSADDGPDFQTEILPVLTKSGCNSAACHGAAVGRGGLRLSLLGYDPQFDYQRLVNEFKGRRLNVAEPDKSLILRKSSRQIPHGGGKRLAKNKDGFQLLRRWIAAGAPNEAQRRLESISVTPRTKLLDNIGDEFSVQVVANFSDGTQSDVTSWTVFSPHDDQATGCTKLGRVTALRQGQSSVMIRFLDRVDSVTVTVPMANATSASSLARNNYVDDHVNLTLQRLKMDVSPQSDDETFLRRVYLDLIGTLPNVREIQEFAADQRPQRRELLVQSLMNRDEFVNHWAYKWGDLLRIESRRLGEQGVSAFHSWIKTKLANDVGLDEIAHQLLLAQGDAQEFGAANFHRVAQDARGQAEFVSQVFLGVRMQCANCHNHPLDHWSQDDYHGLASIFARIRRTPIVAIADHGDVIHPRTGKPAKPRIPGERFLDADADHRQTFARWLTSSNNPYFARTAVNRIWRELMGRGLVEPVDDHRATNPPTHPELLDQLAEDFIANDFKIRHLIKTIVSSAAYQRSSLEHGNNSADDRFYGKSIVRPLAPTVIVDAVSDVTGVAEEFGALPTGTRAISLGDAKIGSAPLELLGRCSREAGCDGSQVELSSSLPLSLHIINGDWINAKIEDPAGRLQQMLSERKSASEIVSQFYLLAYSRLPNQKELDHWINATRTEKDKLRDQLFQDLLWAILNSSEFTSNH